MRADYLLRRLLAAFFVIAGVVTLTFFVVRLVPSDPARRGAGPVSYTHLPAHQTGLDSVCRLLLEQQKRSAVSYTPLRVTARVINILSYHTITISKTTIIETRHCA